MDASNILLIGVAGLFGYQLYRGFAGKIAPQKARELVSEGARLVDVRSPGEHRSGAIKGSLNVPVQELGRRMDELGDKAKPIVVYCASGMRSASAASMLKRAGFTAVHDLGSISRWPS
jgi:rhodanese-related sulfurtransferase